MLFDAIRNKKSRNDEFYTLYEDIDAEIINYPEYFTNKIVYCNCDHYLKSNFVKYFKKRFSELNLKKLIATNFSSVIYDSLFDEVISKSKDSWLYEFDGVNESVISLCGDGDFRSKECENILSKSDIIVSNPPFSLFSEYINLIFHYSKDFLVLGNMNAVTYKDIFPYIQNNKMWYGVSISSGDRKFLVPNKTSLRASNCGLDKDENKFIRVKGVRWFTNLDHSKRHIPLELNALYNASKYCKYENYDIINVDRVCDIPKDYDGIIGVPITFLDKYCPEQFKIIANIFPRNGSRIYYKRIAIQRKINFQTN